MYTLLEFTGLNLIEHSREYTNTHNIGSKENIIQPFPNPLSCSLPLKKEKLVEHVEVKSPVADDEGNSSLSDEATCDLKNKLLKGARFFFS